ncbi:MAG: mannose-6-phosphate isomerase, class I, partial [Jatrophihabitantaceae bacterium]
PDPVGLAGAVAARATPDGPLRPAWLAAQHFPGDIGIAVSVLLNHVRLGPGEAIYLGAGNVHAYLHGMGVEVMASSDNVLRCGLTPKHMDVEAVLGIADFSPLTEPRWAGADGRFAVPVADFALRAFDGAAPTTVDGPAIVLVTGGAVEVGEVPVQQGSAAYVCPRTPVPVRGPGQAFLATAG